MPACRLRLHRRESQKTSPGITAYSNKQVRPFKPTLKLTHCTSVIQPCTTLIELNLYTLTPEPYIFLNPIFTVLRLSNALLQMELAGLAQLKILHRGFRISNFGLWFRLDEKEEGIRF